MRRLPHGGTTRPGLSRPGNGFGRPTLRPGPIGYVERARELDISWFIEGPEQAPTPWITAEQAAQSSALDHL